MYGLLSIFFFFYVMLPLPNGDIYWGEEEKNGRDQGSALGQQYGTRKKNELVVQHFNSPLSFHERSAASSCSVANQ